MYLLEQEVTEQLYVSGISDIPDLVISRIIRRAWVHTMQREDTLTHRISTSDASLVLSRLNISISASQIKDRLKKMRSVTGDEKLSFVELSTIVGLMTDDQLLPERELFKKYDIVGLCLFS